jgi:hypothetical protein
MTVITAALEARQEDLGLTLAQTNPISTKKLGGGLICNPIYKGGISRRTEVQACLGKKWETLSEK